MKYEKVISERMKERMRLSEGRGNKRSDQMDIPFSEPTSKRKELAKIAGTLEGSTPKTLYFDRRRIFLLSE